MSWVLNVKISTTDVIDGLLVDHEGMIRMLQGGVGVRIELWGSIIAVEAWNGWVNGEL